MQKKTFINTLLIASLILVFLPFLTTFSDVFTRIVLKFDIFNLIQRFIVPFQIKIIALILSVFGFEPRILGEYLLLDKNNNFLIEIAWNCVGWQSILFFILTAFVGLQGDRYTFTSKIKTFLFGISGTFIINILRITLIALTSYYLGQNVAIVVHDYGSTLITLIWLLFFWWFSYSFMLENVTSE